MTARGADVENTVDDPGDGWFGMVQPQVAGHAEPDAEPDDESVDTDRWSIRDVERAAPEWSESPRSTTGTWDFTASSGSARYPSKVMLMVAAVIIAAAGVVGIVLLLGGASGTEEVPLVVPSPPLSPGSPASSVPASSVPAVSSQPPMPPPPPVGTPPPVGPPPPPPASAEQMNPPATRHYTPSLQAPDEPQRPQIDVTRAPMSASPPAVSKIPEHNSATPGDVRRHGLFG